nr:Chain B, Rhoptry neck protein 2, putative [Eimeria tenella]4YIZ_D Chain D, Rhoptry neck protein 2, putative [Eimeria tenella]4YIZ_F Chain F, Rhoptry neck protein 2, putative [Eimeria tenella]
GSASDITQHLNDSGLGPAVECLENLVVGPVCPAAVVAPAV